MMIGLTASVFTRLLTMIGGSCLLIRGLESDDLETRLMAVIDYISGMTDIYALDIYQKINSFSSSPTTHALIYTTFSLTSVTPSSSTRCRMLARVSLSKKPKSRSSVS